MGKHIFVLILLCISYHTATCVSPEAADTAAGKDTHTHTAASLGEHTHTRGQGEDKEGGEDRAYTSAVRPPGSGGSGASGGGSGVVRKGAGEGGGHALCGAGGGWCRRDSYESLPPAACGTSRGGEAGGGGHALGEGLNEDEGKPDEDDRASIVRYCYIYI